jgi:hypothetical protein
VNARGITREDLEEKLRATVGDPDGVVAAARPRLVVVGITLGVVVAAAVYMAGRRAGRRLSTVVEVRRV